MITAGDASDTHIIWATLRWAKENTPPAPAPANLWLYWKVNNKSVITGPFKTHSKDEAYGLDCIDQTPLTVPAAQRTWVGLTDDVKLDLISDAKGIGGRVRSDAQLLVLLDMQEDKLKEKNT
jgi:hypothetical protein